MARNVEIKARLSSWDDQHRRASALAGGAGERIEQHDVFFDVPRGRLKLRILGDGRGQLVYYERPDLEGPGVSHYELFETDDPEPLRRVLARAHGVRREVIKTRHLYLVGRTRIHLDRVEGLGDFLELEVVLDDDEAAASGTDEARRLMRALAIAPEMLVRDAYVDLLEARPAASG